MLLFSCSILIWMFSSEDNPVDDLKLLLDWAVSFVFECYFDPVTGTFLFVAISIENKNLVYNHFLPKSPPDSLYSSSLLSLIFVSDIIDFEILNSDAISKYGIFDLILCNMHGFVSMDNALSWRRFGLSEMSYLLQICNLQFILN